MSKKVQNKYTLNSNVTLTKDDIEHGEIFIHANVGEEKLSIKNSEGFIVDFTLNDIQSAITNASNAVTTANEAKSTADEAKEDAAAALEQITSSIEDLDATVEDKSKKVTVTVVETNGKLTSVSVDDTAMTQYVDNAVSAETAARVEAVSGLQETISTNTYNITALSGTVSEHTEQLANCVIKQSGHTINEKDIEAFNIKSNVTEGYYTQCYSLLEQEKEKIKLCTVYKNFDEEGQTASEYNYGLIISQDTEYQQYTSLQGGLHKLFVTNSGVYVSDNEYAPEGGDFGHRVLTKHDTLNYVNKENNRITEEGLESCIFSINPSNGYSQSISLQGNGMQIESYYKSYISLAVGQSKITLDNDGVIINGKLSADAIYQTSDETMKTFGDEIPVDFEKLSKLRKAYFSFNESPNKQEIGVSAQEVKEIYPEIVGSNGNGKLCVDYSKLSVIALAAIDKLNQRLTEIEEKLNKL